MEIRDFFNKIFKIRNFLIRGVRAHKSLPIKGMGATPTPPNFRKDIDHMTGLPMIARNWTL